MKNIFTIDAGLPFLDCLAQEIWHRTNSDGQQLSRMLVLLPTRRACRHLGDAFARISNGRPVLLPRLRPLGDIDEDEIIFADSESADIPPAISPLKRLMLLTQLVQQRDPSLSWDQAAQGADALARFLDQTQIEQCDISKLPGLVARKELAAHWQQTVEFLDIVTKNWPQIIAAHGCIDPAARRNAVLKAQADLWRTKPPDFPVIAAGSTGSVPATADLLDVVAALPQGAVVLPALDRALDHEAWEEIDATHPQFNMKKLLIKIGVDRHEVQNFAATATPLSPRARLIGEAMRPAASTDAWRYLRGALNDAAVAGLTSLTLDHPQEEAQVIALRLRALLEEPDKTAALVTADRALAVRVAALMRRWDVDADDSGGAPLALLPLGTFLNLTLAAAHPRAGAVDLLALLKHPLAACGQHPAACRAQAREAEIRVRRDEAENFDELRTVLHPLTSLWKTPNNLGHLIDAHIAVATALAATDTTQGVTRLWQGMNGEEIAAWFDEWREAAQEFPPVSGDDYAFLFDTLSASKTLRAGHGSHPRLSILGPLEARLVTADLIILGGMNEGIWPPDAGYDPWMSRPMRHDFGLPAPEFRIGLSAHDFAHLANGKQVMITRSLRSNGVPTVPSRFVLQIDTALRAAGLEMQSSEQWRDWARALDWPQDVTPCQRPQPRPPVASRPTALSVTKITTWLRNPYAIYAEYILKLKRLEELDAEPDAADRGTLIHEALEKFLRAYPVTLPNDALDRMLTIGHEVFAKHHDNPRIRAFWWARFEAIADWFITQEQERRRDGTMPLTPESKGVTQIDGLKLTGRADRIDRLADGRLSIVDYKTGGVPTKAEVTAGIEPQLPLLALIASRGGFKDIASAPIGTLEYWALKGGKNGGNDTIFAQDLEALIAEAEAGVKNLITLFANPATPYEAVPRARLQPRYDDYAHLARLAEWGRINGKGDA